MNFLRSSKKQFSSKLKVLVTGSNGQVGSALIPLLYDKYGVDNVICTDLKTEKLDFIKGKYHSLDVSDDLKFREIAHKNEVNRIIHLAAILSAVGERNPSLAIKINVNGVNTALEIAKDLKARIYIPSTIAVFGPDINQINTKQSVPLNPTTVYGITKVYMENIGRYYNTKYGVDFRSLRYPGVVSPTEYESNGTTDYASEIFFAAFKNKTYNICLAPERVLPMIYLEDALQATMQLIEADNSKLLSRVYNLSGLSFSCKELTDEMKKHFVDMKFTHNVDFRDKLAQSWPNSIDDNEAREDWNWNPKINNTEKLVKEMIKDIGINYKYSINKATI